MFKKYSIQYELDDPRTTIAHREIILNKPFLKRWYMDCYRLFINAADQLSKGKFLELGSGGGFLKEVMPEVITSDILELPGVDMVVDAEKLPFGDSELSGIFMVNVFHHIPYPHKFLKEAERTLVKGGKVIMIEPANSVLGRFIYKRFHHEPFDEKGPRNIQPGRPLSHSNQAMPYIYFERDKELFNKEYPLLVISRVKYISPLIYLVSGGVSREAMLPSFMYGFIKGIEFLFSPFSRLFGLFCEVEIRKANGR